MTFQCLYFDFDISFDKELFGFIGELICGDGVSSINDCSLISSLCFLLFI